MKQKPWKLYSPKHQHGKFPRNTKRIKNFEGSLLTNRKVWGWRDWCGSWLQTGQVKGFIHQYVGKTYTELLEAWNRKVKHLKIKYPYEVSLNNWIGKDRFENYREYYVNNEGIICINAEYQYRDHYRIYNSKLKIPNFGVVRNKPIYKDDYCIPYSFKGKLSYPIYVGKFYCLINRKYYLLPIYQCSNKIYHKFQEWWRRTNIPYYQSYKQITAPYVPFKDWLGNAWSRKRQLAEEIEQTWMAPMIPGTPTEQHYYQQVLNPKLPSYRRELFKEMNKEFPDEKYINWLKDQLANHEYIDADFGMGKLCFLVKQKDYINYGKESNKN